MRKKISIFSLILLIACFVYLFTFFISQWDLIMYNLNDPIRANVMLPSILQVLSRRGIQIIALVIAGILTAMAAASFQTMTQSRILTPAVIGFDSLYIMIQTTLVFFFSSAQTIYQNAFINFFLSVIIMSGVTILIYISVLRKNKNNIVLLLLVGLIISTLASNYVNLLQVLMNPESFQTVQSLTSVSIVNIETNLVWLMLPLMVVIVWLLYMKCHIYDVMLLGEDMSLNLGVDYNRESLINLILISIAISTTTALVGPLSFLGLLAVNLTKEMFKDYRHQWVYVFSSFIAIITLVLGQSLIELTGFKTTITTLISFAGGVYMMILIFKEHRI